MTRPEQKKRERSVLDCYLQILKLKGEVNCREAPDFIVSTLGRQIGVEITEYHEPQHHGTNFSQTQVEAERKRLLAAIRKYRSCNPELDNLLVKLYFLGADLPKRSEHVRFIEAIHRMIVPVKSGLGSDAVTKIEVHRKHPEIIQQYLNRVTVRAVECYMDWESDNTVYSVGTTEDELLRVMCRKLGLERVEGLDELHLVVAAGGPTCGSHIGCLDPECLKPASKLSMKLVASNYDVVAILDDETHVWRRGRGWCSFWN